MGISATVNLGFAKARGTYYSGLPSDDILYPDKLERQVAYLESNPQVGWVYSYAHYIDEEGRRLPALFGIDITRDPRPVESLIQRNVIPGMTVLARRARMEEINLHHDEKLIYSDWDFWVRLMAHWKAGFINRALVGYRVHSYNTSVGVGAEVNALRALEVMTALRGQAAEIGGALVEARTTALLELELSYFHFCSGDEASAARMLASAFNSDPALRDDLPYFTRWLQARQHDLLELPQKHAISRDYSSWALRHLPPTVDEAFRRRLKKRVEGPRFSPRGFAYYRFKRGMEQRRSLLTYLLNNPQSLGQDLIPLYAHSLVGFRPMARLAQLKKQLAHVKAPSKPSKETK
jgi:hypothetical protein